jgi:hypothetical protein
VIELSDETLAVLLAKRLRSAKAFQLFVRKLGPNDVIYMSALAWGDGENVVEAKATAPEFEQAFKQLFLNLDQATAPEED